MFQALVLQVLEGLAASISLDNLLMGKYLIPVYKDEGSFSALPRRESSYSPGEMPLGGKEREIPGTCFRRWGVSVDS
jgi:hypothetical protein